MPPGSTVGSLVWMCVWVPITAVAEPSSSRPIATFSLVTSAWKSTSTTGVRSRAASTSAGPASNGLTAGSRCIRPSRLITVTSVPSAARTTVSPRPGDAAGRLAGRMIRGSVFRYG